MNKLVAVAAAVLVLAGCSAAPADETTTQRSAPETSEEAVETEAPEEAVEAPPYTEAEVEFLKWMQSETVAPNVEGKTDAELLAAGWAACEMFAQGIEYGKMEVIEGGYENMADFDIAGLASQFLCTEFDITL